MLHQSTLYRLATVVALFLCATLAVAQSVRVADIGDKFVRNYAVVERGYDLSDTMTVNFFELDGFKSGSIKVPFGKDGELIQFINSGKNRLFVLRGQTDNGKFVRTTMDMNTLLNLLLGNGRANATAQVILNNDAFVDVIYAPVLNSAREVGIWSLPLATKFGGYSLTALADSMKQARAEKNALSEQNKKTDGRVDSLANALRQYDEDHGYFGMILSAGLDGALVSGRLNDPYGLFGAIQLKPSPNFGVKVALVANRMGEGHGGLGGRLEFIIHRVVVGSGYHVFSNYEFSPAWTRHWKNIPLYVGYQIPVAWMVFTPYAGVQINMDFGDLKYDGKWAINRVDPMIGIRGELINLKIGDVK